MGLVINDINISRGSGAPTAPQGSNSPSPGSRPRLLLAPSGGAPREVSQPTQSGRGRAISSWFFRIERALLSIKGLLRSYNACP